MTGDGGFQSLRPPGDSTLEEGNFRRKLSKREKKDLKKKGKLHKIKSINDGDPSVAEKLYTGMEYLSSCYSGCKFYTFLIRDKNE